MADYTIRPAVVGDGSFLADMVVEAANWRADATRPRPSVLSDPVYRNYVAGWQRPADRGFVADDAQGRPIAAAWYRLLAADVPAHGFVAAGVPELIIGVRPTWRAQGVGRALMRQLADAARTAGFSRLALSVEHGNFAEGLYRSEGFAVVATRGGRDTMVRRLG
ncbi:GNAT family N-acetyltransferase [Agromyces salentinus]|uniref:N-acetyltransferase domain-containing protein n=1 Tax=Agromyces salentinus TaxID=269421 RepID=A0ABP4Z8S4_9MICO|nr:GNAT family N-acetyltransferase [Agromyces salentinus]